MAGKSKGNHMRRLESAYSWAMWHWAAVEGALFMVFFEVIGGDKSHYEAMRTAFFKVISFEIRLAMIHAAAQVQWKDKHYLKIWNALREECDKQSGARGKIAHLSGRVIEPEKPHQKQIAVLTHSSVLHPHFPQTYSTAKNQGYTASKLMQMARKWQALSGEIGDLALASLRERTGQHVASSQPPVDPSPQLQHKGGPSSKERR